MHVLKLLKIINLSTCYQHPRDIRVLRAGRVFFENKNKFYIYINITYVYVREITLAKAT